MSKAPYYNELLKFRQGWIYYIEAKDSGAVKIGYARNPASRIGHIQTGNHEELVLLALEKGDRELEVSRHQQFAELRIRGEWFTKGDALRNHIESLAAVQDTEADRCEFRLFRLPDGRVGVVEKLSNVLMAVEPDVESARELAQRWVARGLKYARRDAIRLSDQKNLAKEKAEYATWVLGTGRPRAA